jgi:CBS-domain-containing membrane protein
VNPDAALPTHRLDRGASIALARPWSELPVTLRSPAIDVMTDLTKVKAATTHPNSTLRHAEQLMIYQGVRMLFVVAEMPTIEGLITATDLGSDKPMRLTQERSLHYDELCVADVMTHVSLLDAVGLDSLKRATVASAVATLKKLGRNHLLVVEGATDRMPRVVRGVISRSQIERQLGTRFDVTPVAESFSEIERALR